MNNEMMVDRAQGCLFGQVIGDSLGGLVEFSRGTEIEDRYPHGVRELEDGGTWGNMAGQCTDDSEMALLLARSLAAKGGYDRDAVKADYVHWMTYDAFDRGGTLAGALLYRELSTSSQSNGCLMRISPIGVWGATRDDGQVSAAAREDASITHLNEQALLVCELYAVGVAHAVRGETAQQVYDCIAARARSAKASAVVLDRIEQAKTKRPSCYSGVAIDSHGFDVTGWIMIAFHNALYQLLNAESAEEGIVDTIGRYGDTDTNAAIAGALLGAVHGAKGLPERWKKVIRECRPGQAMAQRTRHPQPERYWPCDVEDLAIRLLGNV